MRKPEPDGAQLTAQGLGAHTVQGAWRSPTQLGVGGWLGREGELMPGALERGRGQRYRPLGNLGWGQGRGGDEAPETSSSRPGRLPGGGVLWLKLEGQ